ncbi:alpha-tubulin N-acetyltransferase isoform X2 [Parasteatoda tepidariorum]|uniref:alpha-tubulin N-acetyltransferase isoform X2 n=1 Tax=Parasteatoda tepidariorum TaxID=114398 RepID=UPI001C722150|nr:alpha-tubulin N-acetyltransferase isoform X2 [Parasteatoda tepidariorum]
MEFQHEIKEILPGAITIIESKDSNSVLQIYSLKNLDNHCQGKDWIFNSASNIWDAALRKKQGNLENVIDQIGLASSRAQDLVMPITTFKKLLHSHQQKLYIIRDVEEPFSVIGILKIGQKRLFICNDMNAQHEVDTMCVLDFYIHESRQRCGYGHKLFEIMLKNENVEPAKLAIDRPSYKFLAFLSKHYNLKDPKPQPNNFVVYEGFLDRNDLRPPIFLYNEKDLNKQEKNFNVHDVMHCYSGTENSLTSGSNSRSSNCCPHSDETSSTLDNYFKKKRTASTDSLKRMPSPYLSKQEKNWNVYDAMHSYSGTENSLTSGSNSLSSNCSLTPGENANSERKWAQLQSSWNVLGVKPLDYSITDKK